MIPLIKLAMLLGKTLAKPFVAVIKKATYNRPGRFRTAYIKLGNKFHSFETIINRRFMGLEGEYVIK